MKGVTVLGATGSIGVNTLAVIADHPDRFRVVSLVAGRNGARLVEQALRFQPDVVAIQATDQLPMVTEALAGTAIRVLSGRAGVLEAATWASAEMVVSAIVGAAGLEPTVAAVRAGKDIALANKECLVMAGALFMREVAHYGVRLIPVDSEHSAIFQVLYNGRGEAHGGGVDAWKGAGGGRDVQALILTASGGPFRGWSRARLRGVTPNMALAHPSWQMGRKISIDSATMMNKGLEVMEAFYLFGVAAHRIRVVVHPQSIVHSMVSYRDGSVLAQMGMPDMRTPIAVALAWPERLDTAVVPLDLTQVGPLHFFSPPERADFPCLALAYQALERGGAMPAVLNAANEVAVSAFLEERVGFLDIATLVEWTMETVAHDVGAAGMASVDEVLHVDASARTQARVWLERHGR